MSRPASRIDHGRDPCAEHCAQHRTQYRAPRRPPNAWPATSDDGAAAESRRPFAHHIGLVVTITAGRVGEVRFRAIGTTAVVLVTEPVSAQAAGALLQTDLTALDLACSRFRPDSEIRELELRAGSTVQVGPVLAGADLVRHFGIGYCGSASGYLPPDVAGSSHDTVVPQPTGLCTDKVPPSASIRSLSPTSPEPRTGSAPPTPSSRTRSRSVPLRASASTSTTEARACFAALASTSEMTQ